MRFKSVPSGQLSTLRHLLVRARVCARVCRAAGHLPRVPPVLPEPLVGSPRARVVALVQVVFAYDRRLPAPCVSAVHMHARQCCMCAVAPPRRFPPRPMQPCSHCLCLTPVLCSPMLCSAVVVRPTGTTLSRRTLCTGPGYPRQSSRT